jgi:transcriptional regulator with XRE-family HTH domain
MGKSIHSGDYKVFLAVLRHARERARLTQEEVAKRLGGTQTFVSKCERGERRLDLLELKDVCDGLGIDLVDLVRRFDEALGGVAEDHKPRRKSKRT